MQRTLVRQSARPPAAACEPRAMWGSSSRAAAAGASLRSWWPSGCQRSACRLLTACAGLQRKRTCAWPLCSRPAAVRAGCPASAQRARRPCCLWPLVQRCPPCISTNRLSVRPLAVTSLQRGRAAGLLLGWHVCLDGLCYGAPLSCLGA